MYSPLGYQVAASFVLAGLKLVAVDHLPDAPVRYLEDPGGLASRVRIFVHTDSIPSPEAFAPRPGGRQTSNELALHGVPLLHGLPKRGPREADAAEALGNVGRAYPYPPARKPLEAILAALVGIHRPFLARCYRGGCPVARSRQ